MIKAHIIGRRLLFLATILCWSVITANSFAHDVVIERNANLRAESNSNSDILILLTPGDEAKLLNVTTENGYYRVLHNEGVGYVWGRNVTIYPEYDRDKWKHWIDADGDCQKTRDEVLIAESEIPVTFKSSDECKVESGRWTDPYSGEVFTDPGDLDVDHMVPLKNAHRSGGWEWTKQRRQDYANDLADPEHLIAVSASLNRSKGAQGPDTWLPPDTSYRCQYVSDWEAIKQRWGLTMTIAEIEVITDVKETLCTP